MKTTGVPCTFYLPTYLYQFLKRRHRHGTRARICPYCYFFLAICVTKAFQFAFQSVECEQRVSKISNVKHRECSLSECGASCSILLDRCLCLNFRLNSSRHRDDKPQHTTKNCSVVYVWAANFRERVFGVARAKAQSNQRSGGGGGGGGVEVLRTWTKAFKNLNRSQHAPHFKLWGTWAKALP